MVLKEKSLFSDTDAKLLSVENDPFVSTIKSSSLPAEKTPAMD